MDFHYALYHIFAALGMHNPLKILTFHLFCYIIRRDQHWCGGAGASDDVLEPQAEYFALRTVLRVCDNQKLFDALCDSRLEENSVYTRALNRFGDVRNDDSEKKFTKAFADWKTKTAANYPVPVSSGTP